MAKKSSENTDVVINVCVDRSGSMQATARETVEGFNTFIDEQRSIPGARLSLTLFDTNFDVRYVAEPLENVPSMTLGHGKNPYVLGGSTALYDAVAVTIKGTEAWLAAHPDFEGKVVTVILTDGQENASREWHIYANAPAEDAKDLNNLIRYKQAEGWSFIFMGSGQSAWLESRQFASIASAGGVFNYTSSNTRQAYAGVSTALSSTRTLGSSFNSASVAAAAGVDSVE